MTITARQPSGNRPIEILGRLNGVVGTSPKWRARCPCHGSRSGALSISEAPDGTILLKCFAGCGAIDIVRSIGLELRDLFPPRTAAQARHREDDAHLEREAYRRDPAGYMRGALMREIIRANARCSCDIDRARRAIAQRTGVKLAAVPAGIGWPLRAGTDLTMPALWEVAPHDDDPDWPRAFMVALAREVEAVQRIDPAFSIDGVETVHSSRLWERAARRAAGMLRATLRPV